MNPPWQPSGVILGADVVRRDGQGWLPDGDRENDSRWAGRARTHLVRQAVTGDARDLPALVPEGSHGQVGLVLTSPPYGRGTHGVVSNVPGTGVHKRHYVYGDRSTGNLAYLGMNRLLDGWREIVAGSMQVLKPGGVFVSPAARSAALPMI